MNAEKAATAASQAEGVSWDYVAINPHVILGPVMCKAHTKSSAALVRQIIYGNALNNYYCQFVDVRDVARAHVEALLRPEAAGNRFVLTNDEPCMNTMDLIPIAAQECPDYAMSGKAQHGNCGVWLGSKLGMVNEYQYCMFTKRFEFKNDHSKQVLGMDYRPMQETVRETALSMIDGGYIKGRSK